MSQQDIKTLTESLKTFQLIKINLQIPFFLSHILITTTTILSLGEYSGKKFQSNDHSFIKKYFFPPKKREVEGECFFRHNYGDFKLHFRIAKMENNSLLGCFGFYFFFALQPKIKTKIAIKQKFGSGNLEKI